MCILLKDLPQRNVLVRRLLNERFIGTLNVQGELSSKLIQERINKLETPDVRALYTQINDLKTLLYLVTKKENSWYIKIKNSLFTRRC